MHDPLRNPIFPWDNAGPAQRLGYGGSGTPLIGWAFDPVTDTRLAWYQEGLYCPISPLD